MSIDMSQADAKDAKLTLNLVAKSGYRAEAKFDAISANQWSRIMAAADGKEQYRVMMAAPALLASCEELLAPLLKASEALQADGRVLDEYSQGAFDRARAAIASARQETRHGE